MRLSNQCAECGKPGANARQLCAECAPLYEPANDRAPFPLVDDECCPTCGRTDCPTWNSDMAGIVSCKGRRHA